MKRVNYLQMSNYQLFRKIRLAFSRVRIPLKSELNFDKLLIVNGLTKYNSLQTFVLWRPVKQHLCRGNAGKGMEVGWKLDGSGMRRKNRNLSYHFPPHSQPFSFEIIDNQQLTKLRTVFGCLRKYPSADAIFINRSLSIFYRNGGWLWGGKVDLVLVMGEK